MQNKRPRYIIIRITAEGVFYNNESLIDWSQTNFPKRSTFKINERDNIFWKAELLDYNKSDKSLSITVADYYADDYQEFLKQQPKSPINTLHFSSLSWHELQAFLSFYKRELFGQISDALTYQIQEDGIVRRPSQNASIEPIQKTVKVCVKHSIQKIKFQDGYVECLKKVQGLRNEIKITIPNDHIVAEFDHIKPYFAKVLNTKRIEITGYVLLENGVISRQEFHSKEIDLINEKTISSIKHIRLKESIHEQKAIIVDKHIFTPDEFFSTEPDDLLGNICKQSDLDLIKEIIDLKDIRNKKQLLYLAGRIQDQKTPLRFTSSPDFGFLFYLQGETMNHLIWELLDSHATYIWSCDKLLLPIDKLYKRIEIYINQIRESGRRQYLQTAQDQDILFSKVRHDHQDTSLKDGFPRWKMKLNEKLM